MPKSHVRVLRSLYTRRAAQSVYERLEGRTMLSVSVNSNGVTVITPNAGDHIIYCSSSAGNDKNNGLSPMSPVATISRAESLVRSHTGDELLFKSGDVWNAAFGYWSISGASAQDPVVISSYGTGPRPQFNTGFLSGFVTGRSSAKEVDYLALMNLNFVANARDPNLTKSPASLENPSGIVLLSTSNDILIENCETQYYTVGINMEKTWGALQNVSVRRNVVIDSYGVNEHAQGLYALGVNNLTLDGNVFDANGYNNQVPGAVPTWYNHDVYLNQSNTNCVIEDNIFSRAAGYGLQDRPGGIVKDNLFIDDPIGMSFGLVNGATTTAGGVAGAVTDNVFIGGNNIGTQRAGQGLALGNIKPGGVVVSGNIFTQGIVMAEPAIALDFGGHLPNPQDAVGINDLSLVNNVIYDWTNGIDVENYMSPGGTGLTAFNNVSFINNDVENTGIPISNHEAAYTSQEHYSGNVYYNTGLSNNYPKNVTPVGTVRTTPIPFVDPTRSIATYDASIHDGGTLASFLAHAVLQNEENYNPVYDATSVIKYIEQGFGLTTGAPPPVVIPPVTTPVTTTPTGTAATSTFAALNYNSQSGGMAFDNYKGLGYIYGGDWIEYNSVNFGAGVTTFSATLSALASTGSIQLRLDSTTGPIIGTLKVTATGAWNNYTAQSTNVSGATGVHKLFLVFVGGAGVCNLESFKFA